MHRSRFMFSLVVNVAVDDTLEWYMLRHVTQAQS